MTPQRTRRTVLGSIASLTALAGCLDLGDPAPGAGGGTDFESVGIDGSTLTVRIADDSTISKVNVIAPDDSLAWERDLAAGARKVTIDIGLSYQPGTHRIVGLDGDTTVAETTLDIAPDIEITRVAVGANNIDEMPEGLGATKPDEGIVEVENNGSGPEVIEKLLILGDVPNPTKDLQEQSESMEVSGIYGPEKERELDHVRINSDENMKLFTSSLPFSFEGEGVKCTSEPQDLSFRIVVIGRVNDSYSFQGSARYSASESYDGCAIEAELK